MRNIQFVINKTVFKNIARKQNNNNNNVGLFPTEKSLREPPRRNPGSTQGWPHSQMKAQTSWKAGRQQDRGRRPTRGRGLMHSGDRGTRVHTGARTDTAHCKSPPVRHRHSVKSGFICPLFRDPVLGECPQGATEGKTITKQTMSVTHVTGRVGLLAHSRTS